MLHRPRVERVPVQGATNSAACVSHSHESRAGRERGGGEGAGLAKENITLIQRVLCIAQLRIYIVLWCALPFLGHATRDHFWMMTRFSISPVLANNCLRGAVCFVRKNVCSSSSLLTYFFYAQSVCQSWVGYKLGMNSWLVRLAGGRFGRFNDIFGVPKNTMRINVCVVVEPGDHTLRRNQGSESSKGCARGCLLVNRHICQERSEEVSFPQTEEWVLVRFLLYVGADIFLDSNW